MSEYKKHLVGEVMKGQAKDERLNFILGGKANVQ